MSTNDAAYALAYALSLPGPPTLSRLREREYYCFYQ
jgi:hypothetical protein